MSSENVGEAKNEGILVVGGGISGMTAAVEAAEVGKKVYLVEKEPYLGGRVVRMNQYFPKLCPPVCGFEINSRRIKQNPRIETFVSTQVKKITGRPGAFVVTLETKASMVNDNCTACGKCIDQCPVERKDDFNYGMAKTKAIFLPHAMAYPFKYVIDPSVCKGKDCAKCVEACEYDAIDLDAVPVEFELNVTSVVFATGWKPYDATRMENLGFGKFKNVVTNVMMERIAAVDGPTGGKIQRPSDGKEPKSIAFVQCAGSRDENHLAYCSGVCCMASLKQSTYVKEKLPDCNMEMFYIDLRVAPRVEEFSVKVQENEKLKLTKGKVAEITEDPSTGNLTVTAEDTLAGEKIHREVEMVVLATGMEPNPVVKELVPDLEFDEHGFVHPETTDKGIVGAGCAKAPLDVYSSVQDATAAALKAIILR
ncbi:MAG: CoB--CoM heterodisulfide reductase iron-sulfur subunit A family protein [Deltaproteobacteria bacterium]|nr:CoB--CoM heterodisulfide reductase iron-sulfur subunit A family protein [Deltaproteobacteria bacterium]